MFIKLYGTSNAGIEIYRATDGGSVMVAPATGSGAITPKAGRCDWIWELDGDTGGGVNAPDFVCTRGMPPCNDARGLYILIINGAVYLYGPNGGPVGGPSQTPSFYFPTGGDGSPDIGFAVIQEPNQSGSRVQAIVGQPSADLTSLDYYENALPNGFVMPYDAQTLGQQGGPSSTPPGFFLTKLSDNCLPALVGPSCTTDPLAYGFAPEGDVTLPGTGLLPWNIPGTTLTFGPNSRLIVDRPFNITGGTLTASNASQGWGGVSVTGGSATFANQSTIQGAGARVTSGTLTLDQSFIQDAPGAGVYATGSSSTVNIQSSSQVLRSSGYGLEARNGAHASVSGSSAIRNGISNGILATQPGTVVTLASSAVVRNNGYDGIYNDFYSEVAFTAGFPVTVRENGNGLRTETVGRLLTGSGYHRFIGNRVLGTYAYDVYGMDGSLTDADYNYWGTNVFSSNDLEIVSGDYASQTILIDPVLTTDPGGGIGARASARSAEPEQTAGGPFVSALGSDTVQGWVEAATQATADGDADGAVKAVEQALGAVRTPAERLVAWGAAARLAIDLRRVEKPTAASSRLDDVARRGLLNGDDAPWALRMLAVGAVVSPEPEARASAREYTLALLAMPGSDRVEGASVAGRTPLSHAAFAHLIETQLALDAGDAAGAFAGAEALAALDPERGAGMVAEIVSAFPDAPALASSRAASRGGAVATEATSTIVPAGLRVYPNPATREAGLSFATAADAEVSLAVYDALGRQVALIAQATRSAGVYTERLSVDRLPAGIYVARLTVLPADGSPTTAEAVRFTVVR